MGNNKRMLSLLMAVLGSVSSSFAAKRRGPNGGSARRGATQGRRMDAGRPGEMKSSGNSMAGKTASARKRMVKKPVVLNDSGNVKLPKGKNDDSGKWSNRKKVGVGVGGVLGIGMVGSGIGFAGRAYHYSDGQICKRNFSRSAKMANDNGIGETSFDKFPAYEMKCDTSGKASLKTRPFVWMKCSDKWYVLMRKDNKTKNGALKDLGGLFKKKQVSDSPSETQLVTQPEGYSAKIIIDAVPVEVVKGTAGTMSTKSVENVEGDKKDEWKGKIGKRIQSELGKVKAADILLSNEGGSN